LSLIVVLIDEVNEFNEPVVVSIEFNLPSWLKLVIDIEELNELNDADTTLNPVVPDKII
jgi:hypothetical protein